MSEYTYPIHEFLTIVSENELSFFDESADYGVNDADILIREGSPRLGEAAKPVRTKYYRYYRNSERESVVLDGSDGIRAELRRRSGRLELTVTPEFWSLSRSSVGWPEFVELLLSLIEHELSRRDAAVVYAAACRSPDGTGVVLFGPSGTGKSTTAFRLARNHGYDILGDDLVLFHRGRVYSFPRYVYMSLSAADHVRTSLDELIEAHSSEVILSEEEVGIPRERISNLPTSVAPDVAFFLRPKRFSLSGGGSSTRNASVMRRAIEENRRYAGNWLENRFVRTYTEQFEAGGEGRTRTEIIGAVLDRARWYCLPCRRSDLIDGIRRTVEGYSESADSGVSVPPSR